MIFHHCDSHNILFIWTIRIRLCHVPVLKCMLFVICNNESDGVNNLIYMIIISCYIGLSMSSDGGAVFSVRKNDM